MFSNLANVLIIDGVVRFWYSRGYKVSEIKLEQHAFLSAPAVLLIWLAMNFITCLKGQIESHEIILISSAYNLLHGIPLLHPPEIHQRHRHSALLYHLINRMILNFISNIRVP